MNKDYEYLYKKLYNDVAKLLRDNRTAKYTPSDLLWRWDKIRDDERD